MDSARYSRCRGHTKTVSPDLFRGPILFKWAFRRNWIPEQVRGDTLSKCHSGQASSIACTLSNFGDNAKDNWQIVSDALCHIVPAKL